jgi:hypothetical protein
MAVFVLLICRRQFREALFMFSLLPNHLIIKVKAHDFLSIPAPTRTGLKTVSVAPYNEEACIMTVDLDAKNNKVSVTEIFLKVEDSLKVAMYVLNNPIVDLVRVSEDKQEKEQGHEPTQH